METDDYSLSPELEKPVQHPLLVETVWLKQNLYEEAEAAVHRVSTSVASATSTEVVKRNKKKDKPLRHPLLVETVWLKQNFYEEAEAAIHRVSTAVVSATSSETVKKTKKKNKPLQHPFLAETVWLKQNVYEDAEAMYHKISANVVSVPMPKVAMETKKRDSKIVPKEEKSAASKKSDGISWSEKLKNKLTIVEDHSKNLKNVLAHLQKGQETSQGLIAQLAIAMNTCLKQVTDQFNANQSCVQDMQKHLHSLNGSVENIKSSRATGDCKSYKSHEIFCQAMTDRLSSFEEEMVCLSDSSKDLYSTDWEQYFQGIISDVSNLHLKMSMAEVKKSESKIASMVTQVDNILKKKVGQKNNPNKLSDENSHSLSLESIEDLSSLSGDCSDFGQDIDDIEEDVLPSEASDKSKKPATGKGNALSKKTPQRVKKTGGMTYKQLQGSSPEKLPKSVSSGDNQMKNAKALKSKTYRNRNSKTSHSSETSGRAYPNHAFTLNNNNASNKGSSMFLTSPSSTISPSLFPACVGTNHKQAHSAFMKHNPLYLEQHLIDMSQNIQQMRLAAKQTLNLQQMLQETERLRQLAIERQQHKLLQEQFQQRYQMLLNTVSQYQRMSIHQPAKVSPPNAQSQAKVQPSARFKDMYQGAQQNPKGLPKPKKQQIELSQVISNLPGAMNVNAVSKEKDKSKPSKAKDKSTPKPKETAFPKAKGKTGQCPYPSSRVIQVASFSPKVETDPLKGGISSMVVLDDLKCLLLVDIINSRLKLYTFTISDGPQKYDFKVMTTLEMPNPYYMARLSYNRVVVTRNGGIISIVQVSAKNIKVINSLELETQYYGVAFIMKNTLAAAAYEANRIDLLQFDNDGSIVQRTLLTHSRGPELLATLPSKNCVVFLDKQDDGRTCLQSVNLNKEVVFKIALGGSASDVWNLSSIGEKIICCNKQQNNLQLISSEGELECYVSPPPMTVNLPFAIGFSHSGDLFLANDGAWECDASHYITTEINVFSFIKESD